MSNKMDRRAFLGMAAAGAAGLMLGDVIGMAKAGSEAAGHPKAGKDQLEPFYGANQSGILTPIQKFTNVAAFDITTENRQEIKQLLQTWTDLIALMMQGKPLNDSLPEPKLPPADTGEQVGLQPARLTVTIGFGASLFEIDGVDRFGFSSKKPNGLTLMPKFHKDVLQDMLTHGDIIVQACADDPIICFHAIRNLSKAARGAAHLRWQQAGQWGMKPESTQRNFFGFKDGTNNPNTQDDDFMKRNVWLGSGDTPEWLNGGTFMVVRRINMRIETWDQVPFEQQEGIIGRQKATGAPLDGKREFDQPKFQSDPDGKVTPIDSHIRLSNPRTGEASERERILRRGFNFMDGLDSVGRYNAGLLFICFNRSIQTQFESIQKRLTNPKMPDQLLAYTQTTGGGYFIVPPGVHNKSSFLGQGLFT